MSEWVNEWMSGWVDEWMSEWVNEWMNEWTNERRNEWMNEWLKESMNRWTNASTSQWINESKIFANLSLQERSFFQLFAILKGKSNSRYSLVHILPTSSSKSAPIPTLFLRFWSAKQFHWNASRALATVSCAFCPPHLTFWMLDSLKERWAKWLLSRAVAGMPPGPRNQNPTESKDQCFWVMRAKQ